MITEDYISFEIAKLLKEKGFNEDSWFHYDTNGDIVTRGYRLNHPDDIPAWTHQIIMKWLREVCNIEINVSMSALNSDNSREYMFNIFFTNERYLEPSKTKTGFKCYEEAAEAAIKYCLTNLIK